MGERLRSASDTHQALQEAALGLFERHGFDGVTAADIAAAAGVTERTFFRHFATKEEVLDGNSEAMLGMLVAALSARPAEEPPLVAVREVALALAVAIEAERDRWRLGARLALDSPALAARQVAIQERWAEAMTTALAARLGAEAATGLRPAVLARVAMAAAGTAINRWLELGGPPDSLRDLIREAFAVLAEVSEA